MAFYNIVFLLILSISVVTCQSATGIGPYGCRPDSGVSLLPACGSLAVTTSSCFANPTVTATTDIQSCFCKQNALNNIVDCESEFRLCYLDDQFDNLAQSILATWHDWCDEFITFTPTTPVLSNPTTTAPAIVGGVTEAICTDSYTPCLAFSSAEAECLNLDPSLTASSFFECACQTSLLSLASVCNYDTNVTCLGQSAALSNIPLYNICGATYSNDNLIYTDLSHGTVITSNMISASAGSSPRSVSASQTRTSPSNTAGQGQGQGQGTAAQTAASSTTSDGAAPSLLRFSNEGARLLAACASTLSLLLWL